MTQREDLLEAAKRCIVDKGYHRTTARDIATAAGSHLASIGYHFGSKDALMNLAALEAQSEWGDLIAAAVQNARASSSSERLTIALRALLSSMPEHRELLVASAQAFAHAAFAEDIRESLAYATGEARRELAGLVLDDPPAAGERGEAVGSIVHALIVGLAMQALLDPDSLPSPEEITAALVAVGSSTTRDES
ncbi:TetR/AcrR family transcriptional regulator [Nocardia farcinica]|nr:TetR/AcrR family transcriptional regulator [Nocardia farcinica]AXK89809.1 TetR/AcrR family transcriptional regulator [Nocardia farcinica]MBF6230475.1 TetR/AcrR family transcriptional regulator [Nocardia farcinica]MBF6295393.1 TetR/AcrR family transcriptional regulator [Nocardia farcinica]MBF6376266.1 TetR/AcrR family transcriptional regulator [Nocardia farcinica]MBF6381955.1 TetR/AcrR family transcriptional regulator [Nocardia farcinica]